MNRRRRHYLHLWLLLAAGFAVMLALSAFAPVGVGNIALRDSGLAEALVPQQPVEADEAAPIDTEIAAVPPAEPAQAAAPVDTASKTILFFGDSMLDGLSPRLAAYASHNGHSLYTVIWYGSTSETWGTSTRLADYIARLKPDYIFLCLGANELFVRDIATKRAKHVDKIITAMKGIPYVWIGPPNWKPDTGINSLISSKVPGGSFFLSNGMTFERNKDGAHPTTASAALWMDSVVNWMATGSAHPIRLEKPTATKARAKKVFIHKPGQ